MRRGILMFFLLTAGCLSEPDYAGRPCGPGDGCPDDFLCHLDDTCRRKCDFAAPCPSGFCVDGICLPEPSRDAGIDQTMGGPCEGAERRCTMPPDDVCEGDVFRTYAREGVCDTATMRCVYAVYEEPCVNCTSQCLGPCATLDCDDNAGGCRENGRCEPDTMGGVRCAYDIADDGATCTRPAGAGVCIGGVCGDCSNNGGCTSADLCLTGVQCVGGSCVGGTQTVCDTPPDACHEAVGTCQPSTGECVYPPIQDGSPCEDGNLCTEGETCMAGVCEGGSAINCDDSNVCTTDGCIPATGCDFRPNSNPCDDRDLCTYADTCNNGLCLGTTVTCTNDECVVRECNGTASCNEMPLPGTEPCSADGNPCTDDFCDGFGLCAHRPKLNGASCGAASADRCCGGTCVDISSNRSHCGGCNTACTGAFTCESVSVTNTCSSSPANTTGRCRCNADNSHCPRGQVCRTFTPFTNRCAPASATNCAPGTSFTDLAACPNYCGF